MTNRRAFTLIEVLICVGLLSVMIFPLYTMVENVIHSYDKAQRQVNLRADLDRLEAKIKLYLRHKSKFRIGEDNRGGRRGDGSTLSWKDGKLTTADRVLADNVGHFSLFRRDGLTFVTLSLIDPVTKRSEQKQFVVEEAGYASRI